MAKRYCDGCGGPLLDRQSVCSNDCLEKVRAKLQSEFAETYRTKADRIGADVDTLGTRGDPLVNGHFPAPRLPRTFRDTEHAHPEAARVPFAIEEMVTTDIHHISRQPFICFTVEALRVDPVCATYFDITPIMAGNIMGEAGGDQWMPATLFAEWKRYDLPEMSPANQFQFRVRKHIGDNAMFRCVLFGIARMFNY